MSTDGQTTFTDKLRAKAGEVLRRTADVVDGTAEVVDMTTVHAGGGESAKEGRVRRKRRFTPPMQSLRGYQLADLPRDLAAGAVVAALSIPIAMGYAEVVGLPAIYGLYASIIAPLAFALATGTRRIVFGMDSAVSAVTGSMLVSTGLAYAGEGLSAIIPLVTILTGLFLALFSFLGAGRLARFIPAPVMHGFIAGVSLTVIVTQIPGLLGTTADMSGGFVSDVLAVFGSLPDANGPSTLIAAISLGLIVHLRRTLPKVPAALVVLIITTVLCAVLHLDDDGVSILGSIDAGLPLPTLPFVSGQDLLPAVGCAAVIAVVASIESLLCLETFSMKAGVRPEGNRELLSFGVGNVAAGLFGCPPCSASLSRTAAGISAGARTQATSIAAAVIVALVVLVLSPALYYLPRPALCAIVTVALIDVVDFEKARRYARHMLLEFAVFMISAIVVLACGAIVGVFVGIVASLVVAFYRNRRHDQEALLGVMDDEDLFGKTKSKPKVDYAVLKLEGHLSFLNIDAKIDALLDELDENTRAIIVKLNKVDSLDSTAADKLILLVDMLHARHIHFKIVRKMRPTNDSITRYEMRRIMRGAKFYPSMGAALAGLQRDMEREEQQAQAELPEAPGTASVGTTGAAGRTGADTSATPQRTAAAAGTAAQGAAQKPGQLEGAAVVDAPGTEQAPTAQVGLLGGVSTAAHGLSDLLMSKISKEEPLDVRADDRIVMTIDPTDPASDIDLRGKLAYIRAHEAVLFEVAFEDEEAPQPQDEQGQAQQPQDDIQGEASGEGEGEGATPAALAADESAEAAEAKKAKAGKGKKAKAGKKTDEAAAHAGADKKGGEVSDPHAAASKKAEDAAAAHAGAGKKGAHKKAPAKTPAKPAYATVVLRREKTGEVLARYADGAWVWNYPTERLAPAVDLIDQLARSSRP